MMAILDIYTDETPANWANDIIRWIFHSVFNRFSFWLLGIMYEIFFNVATVELLESETIRNFYGRIQLILGVFMVFRLSIVVLQAIVDPDRIQDKKEGFSAVIKRVVIGLLMLTVLTPINIPNAKNKYQVEVNNNGILFGTLYSLQYRILEQNTIGRLILGTTDGADDTEELKSSASIFKSTIAKAFININLIEGATDDTKSENWMCGKDETPDVAVKEYSKIDADPSLLFGPQMVNMSCKNSKPGLWTAAVAKFTRAAGNDRYVFNYIWFMPFIMALIFAFILLGFTVDIAIRSIKLTVLRLIAPIPIIAYMGPESKDNSAFPNWVKALVGTYVDVFVRLAIIYFVLFLIMDMIKNGIIIKNGTGMVGILSAIFVFLGLFLFARQAPKFIMDVLGVKSLGSNIGLSTLLGGAAMLGGGFLTGAGSAKASGGGLGKQFFGGLRGAGMGFAQGALNGMTTSNEAIAQGKEMPLHNVYAQNRDLMAQIRTGDKEAKGGMVGYWQDRLNYQNRELRANSLGIGKNTMAAALYEDEVAGDNYRNAQAATQTAASKVSALKGINGMMSISEWATKTGNSATDTAGYNAYQTQYNNAVAEWQKAQAYEEKARVQTLITGAAKKSIDQARASLGTSPRAADVYSKSYRSQSEINYYNETLHNKDGSVQYELNEDGSYKLDSSGNRIERKGSTRIAVDSEGRPLATFVPGAYDDYGHQVLEDTKVNQYGETVASGRRVGKDTRPEFTYERSTRDFAGTIDDSTFGSSGRGSTGGGPGGAPGPHP